MFKYITKNNKGFTLIEMLICIALLGAIIPTTGALLHQFTNAFNTAMDRGDIQKGVQTACKKFDYNAVELSYAYNADILYDPVIEDGVIVKEDGSIKWKNSRGYPYVIAPERAINIKDPYTYIFSAPAYDEDGNDLGYRLFIRRPGKPTSEYLLKAEGLENTPVKISFSIAESREMFERCNLELFDKDEYLTNTIKISFESGLPEKYQYSTEYFITFSDMVDNSKVNYTTNYLSLEKSWFNKSILMAHPAGWTNETLNNTFGSGYPENLKAIYFDSTGASFTATVSGIDKPANVLRFISDGNIIF